MTSNENVIREVFSIAGNICLPTIEQLIKSELVKILESFEQIIDKNNLKYLITILNDTDVLMLEKRYDELNINFVELTYTLYEVWMSYIENMISFEVESPFHLDKDFVEMTSEPFLTCILNDDVLSLYNKFYTIDALKVTLLGIDIEKHENDYYDGITNVNETYSNRIKIIFSYIKSKYYNDSDINIHNFINEYQYFCELIIECIEDIDKILRECQERYIKMCIKIFGDRIDKLYHELERKNISIDIIKLKLHILEYLRYLTN